MIYVLSGGRSKNSDQTKIEYEAFKLLNKDKINILFCPLAQLGNENKCIDKFNEYMKPFNYDVKFLLMDF